MGQTRPVTIYRLLSIGTIEEGIYQVAQEKLNLEKHVTGADGMYRTWLSCAGVRARLVVGDGPAHLVTPAGDGPIIF